MPWNSMIIWIGLLVFFLIIEVVSFQLIAVWFAAAALTTFFLSFMVESLAIQSFIFLILSGGFFGLFYPLSRRIYRPKADTNSERVIGKEAVVIEEIDPAMGKGQVKVDGKEWSVKSKNPHASNIAVGTVVKVLAIEGVKLVIEHQEEA
ncbi:NfeD family protein [Entomospira culicis]|uniref:NfeD family protein n=1 Tax=Entomospira culicis TaxID=2719989 RepID=A0A968GFH9_9SPIO|nr:NfeD family protein [Entomospira culicis]NIZ19454.1 NfeD family protein [Entomospira culicis]NIZ69641.1 NfeD family protein [Entomospira culicis]WDI36752.1 NfeD family protein [Entomospira culicis]WDI38381.1 NfeD family protein [Entomospira culicis]